MASVSLLAILIASTVTALIRDVRSATGPFQVGEIQWGPEILTSAPQINAAVMGKPRPIVQVWYPSQPASRDSGLRQLWGRVRRALRGRKSNSAEFGAPIAPGSRRFPLIIYFPGWFGTRIENYGLLCELASHGFIVAGVTYPARLSGMSDAAHKSQIRELGSFPVYTSLEVYRSLIAYSTDRVRFRARDASWLVDALLRIDAGSRDTMFTHRVDMTQIGIVGFSLGGAVAAETATMDPRIRAAVNVDGRHWGTGLHEGVKQPYLFIGEELLVPTQQELTASDPNTRYNAEADKFDYAQLALNLRRNGGIQVTVQNATHMDFTDDGSVGGLRRLLRPTLHHKRIHPARVLAILNACVLAFLQKHLTTQPTPLLTEAGSKFPEVRVDDWSR